MSAYNQNYVKCTTTLMFSGIEKVTKPLRGGDLHRKLFNRESFWIYNLHTRSPNGLNVRQDLMYIYKYVISVAHIFIHS